MKRIFYLFIIVLIIFLPGCSPAKEEQGYIVIGVLLPLTGTDSDEGMRALNGLQLAKQEINENGGVLGKKLDIIVLNDKGDEEYVVEQYNKLVKLGAVAIIGSSYSGVTLALAKEAEKDGIPVISPTASNPDVTIGRDNVFRAIFIDDYQAEVMARFALDSLNAKTALILINDTNESFKQNANVFIKIFSENGGIIKAVESYSVSNRFSGILAKYTYDKPDVIFCPEDYMPAARLVNSAYEAGLDGTYILGTDAWDGILTYMTNPEAMKNGLYSAPFSFDDQDEEVVIFVKKYFNAFSQMPLSGSATAYTCVYILAEAIKTANGTNKEELVSAIKASKLDTITGHIKFDANNNPQTNVYIIQIKDGVYSTYLKKRL